MLAKLYFLRAFLSIQQRHNLDHPLAEALNIFQPIIIDELNNQVSWREIGKEDLIELRENCGVLAALLPDKYFIHVLIVIIVLRTHKLREFLSNQLSHSLVEIYHILVHFHWKVGLRLISLLEDLNQKFSNWHLAHIGCVTQILIQLKFNHSLIANPSFSII